MKIYISLFMLAFCSVFTYSQSWHPMGSGIVGTVYALSSYGNYGYVFAGGLFYQAGGVTVHNIAQWYNGGWAETRGGTVGPVSAITGGPGYIGGAFTYAGPDSVYNICAASYNGYWSSLGYGLDYAVSTISLDSMGNVYAGGSFTNARFGPQLNNVGKWSQISGQWSPLGVGTNSSVYVSCIYNGKLVVGGSFTLAGGNNANHLAQWNGSSWSAVGGGVDGTVHALMVFDGDLIVGGDFTNAGTVNAMHIAKWNGSTWSAFGPGLDNTVRSLSSFAFQLVAGGDFIHSGSNTVNHIAKWYISYWQPMSGGTDGTVYALSSETISDSSGTHYTLTAGGDFVYAGGIAVSHVAQWVETDPLVKGIDSLRKLINKPITPFHYTNDTFSLSPHDNINYYTHNVSVTLDTVNFPNDGSLEFYLIHQSLTDTIVYHNGNNGSNFLGTMLDASGPYSVNYGTAPFMGEFKPYTPLSKFNNVDPSGNWILSIYNNGSYSGTLEAWSLHVEYSTNPFGIKPISSDIPKSFALMQNYPNPFNPSTKVKYLIQKNSNVTLKIYDILGKEVETIVNETQMPGTYEVGIDGRNLSSGIYLYRLIAKDASGQGGEFIETRKMVLLK